MSPTHQPLPAYYDEWIGRWRGGEDVRKFYGQPAMRAAKPQEA